MCFLFQLCPDRPVIPVHRPVNQKTVPCSAPPFPYSYLAWLNRKDISGNGNLCLGEGRIDVVIKIMPWNFRSTGSATDSALTLLTCGCPSPLMAVESCLHRFWPLKKGVAPTVLACKQHEDTWKGGSLRTLRTVRKMHLLILSGQTCQLQDFLAYRCQILHLELEELEQSPFFFSPGFSLAFCFTFSTVSVTEHCACNCELENLLFTFLIVTDESNSCSFKKKPDC